MRHDTFLFGQAALIIMSVETLSPGTSSPPPKKYVRAVGPRLRKLLYVIFALVALLGANSVYLAAVTAVEWSTGRTYQNYFYQYMFLGHLVLGLVLIVPFVVFGMHAHARRRGTAGTAGRCASATRCSPSRSSCWSPACC